MNIKDTSHQFNGRGKDNYVETSRTVCIRHRNVDLVWPPAPHLLRNARSRWSSV